MDPEKDWFTVEELASWLDIPPDSVMRGVKAGTLPALVIDGHLRFSRPVVIEIARRAAFPRAVPVYPASMSRRPRVVDPEGPGPSGSE